MTQDEITEVEKARHYIKTFCRHTMPGTRYVDTTKRRINLNDMTDEDALFVAEEFQRLEVEVAQRGAKLRRVQ